MGKPRNSDGTIRRANRPKGLTNRSLIARWVEAETLHLKRLGMSYQAIAEHITAVAQGQRKTMVAPPAELRFPQGYRISMQAVHSAFKRGIVRLPNAEAAELRKLDNERLEDMLLSLQPGIRQGDPRAIEVGVRVLVHKADINGYKAPARVEMTNDSRLKVNLEREAQMLTDLDRLTVEELREYRRLEAKAHGIQELIEVQAVKTEASADPADASAPNQDPQTDKEGEG
ncbi:MAG: hypothetical protein ABSD31_17335 [Candidatus Binataceae bacterium]|jgi:hypothetical protein